MGICSGRALQAKGTAFAKVARQEWAWCVEVAARKPVWLELSKQAMEKEVDNENKWVLGADHAGPCGAGWGLCFNCE